MIFHAYKYYSAKGNTPGPSRRVSENLLYGTHNSRMRRFYKSTDICQVVPVAGSVHLKHCIRTAGSGGMVGSETGHGVRGELDY